MNRNEIEIWVIGWFVKNSAVSEADIKNKMDENIFNTGVMDSLKFVFFVTEAESNFQIKFSQEDFDFTQGKFTTIRGLCDLIEGHLK